jgi:hypothetical protein
MTQAVSRGSDVLLLASLTATAAGFGFVNAPITYIAAAEMPAQQAGVAAATTSTSRLVGGALGVAVVGSVLAERSSGPAQSGFVVASGPCWWIISGCGFAILGISLLALSADIGRRYDGSMSTVLDQDNRLHEAARRLAEAETALHAARQSHVDDWIRAASDKLHEAAVAYVAALGDAGESAGALPERVAERRTARDHRAQLR